MKLWIKISSENRYCGAWFYDRGVALSHARRTEALIPVEIASIQLDAVNGTDGEFTAMADIVDAAYREGAKAMREKAAKLCREEVTYPAGYGGRWEGYGPLKAPRDGKACAAAIEAIPL